MKPIDLTGKKFDRLTAIKSIGSDKRNRTKWLCECDCGNTVITLASSLLSGNTKSCGCIKREMLIQRNKKGIHGYSRTKIYRIWYAMKQRCSVDKDYAGRGISVCNEWLDFQVFKNWAFNNGYSDGLSIDRIDVNGNYEPANCRWIELQAQANNKRNNHFITYNGETRTLAEWSRKTGIESSLLRYRLSKNMSLDKVFTKS